MVGRKKKWKKRSVGNQEQPSQPEFTLFLDETLFNCASIHAALTKSKVAFVRHDELFKSGTYDQDWLPIVGQKRLVVLTSDKRIRFNDLERAEVIEHGVRQFVFSSGHLSGQMMGELLSKAMPKIQEVVAMQEAPFIACITKSGNVEVRYDSRGSVFQRRKKDSEVARKSNEDE
jgi:hypothetical protein